MRPRNLFGIPIPEAAVRVVIRPVLGPGGSLPLYKGSFDEETPEDDDVIFAAAKNTQFWEYLDKRASDKRQDKEAAKDWKLRLQFFDSKEGEESFVTDGTYSFFRAVQAKQKRKGSKTKATRLFKLLKRSHDKAIAAMTEALCATTSAAAQAVGEVTKASSTALTEVSKQTAVVSELVKLLHAETVDLKTGIFELQTKAAQPQKSAPKTAVDEVKDVMDAGKMMMSLAEGFAGPASSAPQSPSSEAPADKPGDK